MTIPVVKFTAQGWKTKFLLAREKIMSFWKLVSYAKNLVKTGPIFVGLSLRHFRECVMFDKSLSKLFPWAWNSITCSRDLTTNFNFLQLSTYLQNNSECANSNQMWLYEFFTPSALFFVKQHSLRSQINEPTWSKILDFFPTLLALFPPYSISKFSHLLVY